MKTKFTLFMLLSIFIGTVSVLGQEAIRIKEILSKYGSYKGEVVTVAGLVTQYVDATERTTAYFLIKDDYGAIIKINTADPKPETNQKYQVTGILYYDEALQMPFISEKSRIKLDNPIIIYKNSGDDKETWLSKNLLVLIIGGSGLLLLVLFTILISRKKKPEPFITNKPDDKQGPAFGTGKPTPRENLKTMVIPVASPKTMKFIPGELEVLTGDDKGKIFKISGYPTEEGSIVTVGRETVTGQRDFAHIQLKESTISRRQAEIIYKDGKLYIRNLSETNYTKLDGKDIPPNSVAELKSGSIIAFGEIQMKYTA